MMEGPGPMRTLLTPSYQQPEGESADARAPDDDLHWRQPTIAHDWGVDPGVRKEALLSQCEERLDRAWAASRPKAISYVIEANSCTALKGGRECVKCRICPNEEQWQSVQGYYRPNKSKIFICAEKEPSLEQVTLCHLSYPLSPPYPLSPLLPAVDGAGRGHALA